MSWRRSSGCGTASTRASRVPGCVSSIPMAGWCRPALSARSRSSSARSRSGSARGAREAARRRGRGRECMPARPPRRARRPRITVIDIDTYSRSVAADLPAGHNYAASANRLVAEALGVANTQSVTLATDVRS
ncbi:MAG: hypothetical protein GY820_24140 [Gammaproteobacteria bacterium]|nr:hypothetical protein [Gammaproteobacteria bacterium]